MDVNCGVDQKCITGVSNVYFSQIRGIFYRADNSERCTVLARCARWSLYTLRTLCARWSLYTLWALCALRSYWTLIPLRPCRALVALWPFWPLYSLLPILSFDFDFSPVA